MLSIEGLLSPAIYALILLAIVLFCFIHPKIPNYMAGFIVPFFCNFTGVMKVTDVLTYYSNATIWMILCMHMFGNAFFEVGLADDVGDFMYRFISRSKVKDPTTLCIAVIMIVTGVCSMFLQNLGVTLAFIPVVLALAQKTGISRSKLLILLPVASALGGASTLTGTPMHASVNGAIAEFGLDAFGMFDYAYTAVPIWICCLLVYIFFHKQLFKERYIEDPALVGAGSYESGGSVKGTPYQKAVVAIGYIAFILCIVFKKQLGVTECAGGMIILAFIAIFRGLPLQKISAAIKPTFLLQAAALLATVAVLRSSGAAELMMKPVSALLGSNPSPIMLVAVFYLITAILTQFMVNEYTALLMVSMAVPYCQSNGIDPTGVVMAILMGANNCLCTPLATTANLVVMEDGHIEFGDFLKPGLVLMAVGLVVNLVLIPIIWF